MPSKQRPPRLIVLSFHFPPNTAVGGLRWSGLSKYLARRGWEVHVISAHDPRDIPQEPGVFVHYCPKARTLNDVYSDWANRRRAVVQATVGEVPAPTAVVAAGPVEPPPSPSLSERIRRELGGALAFPDYGRGWVIRAARMARAIQREEQIDAIVSSGPPHSGHIAGLLASIGLPVSFIVDMRDPWIRIPSKDDAPSERVSWVRRGILTHLEALIFLRAGRFIANTFEFSERLKRRYPTRNVSYISNGVDRERLPAPAPKFEGLCISYAGALYLGRDLSPIVYAMKRFIAANPAAAGVVKLRIAGLIETVHEAKFRAQVDGAGLHDAVEVRGVVSPAEALDMTNRSHLVIVLAQNQPTQIPAKLYECVGMGLPTLIISEPESAASREARRLGAMACAADDVEGVSRVIEQLWLNPAASKPAGAAIGYDDIAVQMDEVLRRDIKAYGGATGPSGEIRALS